MSYDAKEALRQAAVLEQMEKRMREMTQPYPPPHADEVRLTQRLERIERKLDKILAMLCPTDS